MMYDVMAFCFVLACLAIWKYPPIHTGTFGSLGLVVMAIAAVFSMDDGLYGSPDSIKWCFVTLMGGAGLVMLHVLFSVQKMLRHMPRHASEVPLRRSTDYGDLDDGDRSHGMHA
jgi:hypothetical protein